jgi:penicillin-binding protein 1A
MGILPVDIALKSEHHQQRLFKLVMLGVLAVVVFVVFLLSVELGYVMAEGATSLPDIRLLKDWRPNESTRIFDRNGTLIANIHGDEDRVVVPLSDISPNIVRGVMAIEDNRFYEHSGVDVRGTLRAFIQNVKGSDVQGGSTVTQQLVKNLFLSPERSVTRKLAEAILAVRVEKAYNKDKIMEMYLNQVYWGNHAYGIEKAARRYFKKPASDLTVAEAALLAGLLKAPEGLSPFAYPEAARRRQLEVLGKMVEYGYISDKQRRVAEQTPLVFNSRDTKVSKHPYFIAHVIKELETRFGEDLVRRGGLRVYTTMDEDVQTAAEKALETAVKGLKGTNVTQGALVSLDVQTDEIMALVGGVDFTKNQFNNATQAQRAAGSSFKPIVYLTGLRLGVITPETPIVDRPISMGNWHPHNWDGRYMGPMTVRQALTLSRNTTTVQVAMKVGLDAIIETAKLAGITSTVDNNFSSVLGSSGFTPLEVANAYSTFARGGIRMQPTALRRVEDGRGRQIDLKQAEPVRAFEPEPIASLVSILVDVVEKGTGKNAQLPGRVVAGKTGTTDSVRDIWFTGFTPDMAACVWMGNTKYVPLHGVFSSNAAKVWHEFATHYYKILPIAATDFPKATGGKGRLKEGFMQRARRLVNRPRPPVSEPAEAPTQDPQADNDTPTNDPSTADRSPTTTQEAIFATPVRQASVPNVTVIHGSTSHGSTHNAAPAKANRHKRTEGAPVPADTQEPTLDALPPPPR